MANQLGQFEIPRGDDTPATLPQEVRRNNSEPDRVVIIDGNEPVDATEVSKKERVALSDSAAANPAEPRGDA